MISLLFRLVAVFLSRFHHCFGLVGALVLGFTSVAVPASPVPSTTSAADAATFFREVVFIDKAVAGYEALVAGVRPGVETVLLDPAGDELAQMAEWAETHSGYDAIHVLSHGVPGSIRLGGASLGIASLGRPATRSRAAQLGRALAAGGDLLLYGCEVAKGEEGESFLAALASTTGADVAASTGTTGAAAKGGDWVLEKEMGQIGARSMLNDSGFAGFSGLLATVTFVEGSAEDLNIESGAQSFARTIDGATFTFANESSDYAGSYFDIQTMNGIPGDGFAGVYSLTARNAGGGVDFTVTVQNGYTFDLTEFTASADTNTIRVYYNGMTSYTDYTLDGANTATPLASLTGFNDVTSVTFSSENYALFQGLIITDVKAPPTLSTPSTIIYTDTAAANTFSNQTGTLTASASAVTTSPIASYGISGGTSGGSTDISGTLYDVSQAGTYGTLYVKSSDGSYVYVPNATAINATSSAQSETFTVTATDNAAATSTATLMVNITGANDTPAITSGATASVAENSTGTIYTATASDADTGQTLSYSLGGTDASLFNINSGTGAVSFKVAPNYEVPSDAGGDNDYDITVTATDSGAGSLNASRVVALTVTNVLEFPGTTVATATLSADTGSSLTDFTTNTASQTISGTLTANLASGEKVQVSYDNGSSWSDATSYTVASSVWSTTTTLSGSNTFQAWVTNADGSSTAYTQGYTLDTTDPTTTVSTASFSADTGSSNADFITKTAAQTISGTTSANLVSGEIVEVSLDNGSTWTTATTSVGTDTWSLGGQTLVGSDTLKVRVSDTAGNSSTPHNQAYVLDIGIPTTTIATAAFSADTGTSSTDFITKTAAQTISGTTSASLVSGEIVEVSLDNGSTWATATTSVGTNTWSLGSQTLVGSDTLRVRVSDTAGNSSTPLSQAYVLDTGIPTTTIATAAFSADTGESNTDFITKTAAQTISGTTSANLVSGEIVEVSLDNGSTWTTATTSVGTNTWSLSGQTLVGSDTLKVLVSDTAGNSSTPLSQAYVLDTGIPTTTIATAAFSADTGTSSTDFITKTAAQTISGTTSANLVNGEIVEVSLDNGSTWATATTSVGANTWSLAGQTLAGSNTLKVRVSDTAGNSGVIYSQAYVLDLVAPSAPSTPDLATGSDSGTSSTDNVTSATTPIFTGTAEAGATVTLYDTDGTTVLGSGTATGGDWSITSSALADGSHTITAKTTDTAGSASAASSVLTVTIDTTQPTISLGSPSTTATATGPVTFTVTYADTNFNASTLTTGNITLNATGGANATLGVSGTGTTRTVTLSSITGNGTLGITIAAGTASDTAGNLAPASSASTTFTIDTTAPTLDAIARLVPLTVNTDATTATWRVTFAEGVSGVDFTDFTLTTLAGTPAGTIASVTPVSALVYDVTVNALSGQGQLRLDLKAAGTGITDLAGNALADGGFGTGDFYLVGATSVLDTLNLPRNVWAWVNPHHIAQRFTTAAGGPLTLSRVAVVIGSVTGTPSPVVTINADLAGKPGTVIGTLTNPASIETNALNVWTGNVLLAPSTIYWLVVDEPTGSATYQITASNSSSGGSGAWLTNPDYVFRFNSDWSGTFPGVFSMALGAVSTPIITSALTANGTYRSGFADYTITASPAPTSFAATGLPGGLGINTATGVISGTPTQAGVFNVALTATNGSGTGTPSTLVLTVAKAALTATASNASRAYGEPNPVFSVSCSGFLGGDTVASLTTAPSATSSADAASSPGNYPTNPMGGVSDNYSFNYINGTLTVTAATQSISFAPPGTIVFGASVMLSASASSGLPVTFEVVSGPATISGDVVLTTGVGEVIVRASQSGNANFNAAPDVERRFAVAKAPQTIAFAPLAARTYGEAPFALAASASSGLDVTFTVTSGPATIAGSTVTLTGSGEVVVTASQSGSATFAAAPEVERRITVAKAPASVALGNLTPTYDGTPRSATATTTPSALAVVFTYNGSSAAPIAAGTYAVVATIEDTNYTGSTSASFVIAPALPTLTWPSPTPIPYGTPLSAAQLNASANVPGTFTYTPAAGTILHAGTQPLAAAFTPTDAVNYTAASAQTSLTVTLAPLTVQADNLEIALGSPIPAGTLRFSGWVNGDGPSALLNAVVVATSASASSPVGTYALVPVGGASFDYTLTRINGTLTITDPNAPAIITQPDSQSTTSGDTVTLSVAARGTGLTYQWYRQGLRVPDATSPTLALPAAGPTTAGIYDCVVSGSGRSLLSSPVVVGIEPAADLRTAGEVATRAEWQGIQHPAGKVYDQFLLAGNAGTFTATPGRVARMSFLDENESIVQVEMSGAGAVTIVLANASGPMAPALYNQPGILYMKGKATIVLAGADETTHFTIYSVGTATNPGVTRSDVEYAGWADVAVAGIVSTNGGLGGIHQGNAAFTASTGFTGLYAPTVTRVTDQPVVVHDIAATANAVPYLYFAPAAQVQVKIAGGSLAQPNNDVLTVSGLAQVQMGAGQDSCGRAAPAQAIRTSLVNEAGANVTDALVVGP